MKNRKKEHDADDGSGRRSINDKDEKQKNVERFYMLLKALMDELFEYAPKSKHVKMPYNVSFGLIYDERNSVLFSGVDQKTGKKMYLYNVRIIGKMFEERRKQMLEDKTTATLFSWIADVCSICISPFVYDYVVNVQHRGQGAAERTARQIVRGFLDRLVNDPELRYVLDTIRDPAPAAAVAASTTPTTTSSSTTTTTTSVSADATAGTAVTTTTNDQK